MSLYLPKLTEGKMQFRFEILKFSEMKHYKALNNLSRLIIFLAWTEVILATILAIYAYKNSQVFGQGLTIVLYGLAGFVLIFAFGKNLALVIDIRKHQVQNYSKVPVESYAYREFMLIKLHDHIEKQKNSLFRRKYKDSIILLMNVLIPSRQDAIEIIDLYRRKYNKNITSELEGLTSSYDLKREYLKKFIDYGLVEEEYPHRLAEDDVDSE